MKETIINFRRRVEVIDLSQTILGNEYDLHTFSEEEKVILWLNKNEYSALIIHSPTPFSERDFLRRLSDETNIPIVVLSKKYNLKESKELELCGINGHFFSEINPLHILDYFKSYLRNY